MRARSGSALLLSVLLLSSGCAAVGPDGGEPPAPRASGTAALRGLGWLAGTWSGPKWGGTFVAHYTTPETGLVLGFSRLLRDGEVAFHEFEVFEPEGDVLRYLPHPNGRPAEGFVLSELDAGARRAVFENPDKDFPTRATFRRVGEDALEIVLDDPHGDRRAADRFLLHLSAPADTSSEDDR